MLESLVFSPRWTFRLGRHLLYWLFWWFLLALIYGTKFALEDPNIWWGINRSYWIAAMDMSPNLLAIALFMYGLQYGIIPHTYPRGKWLLLAVGSLLLAAVCITIETQIALHVINPWKQIIGRSFNVGWMAYFFAFTNLLKHGSATSGLAAAIRLLKQNLREREINSQLQQRQLETELEMLRLQLHPHFLFNNLNNIYGLIMDGDKRQAGDVVIRLSGLLRYMLHESAAPLVPLDKELEHLHSYVLLEQIRCADRLELGYSVQGKAAGKQIAPLILLPFVENSFKHGLANALEGGWINIDIQIREHSLHCWIANSKPEQVETTNGCGIGLKNSRKRLELLYPNQYTLKIADLEDSFSVTLEIPLHT
ncbi:sensor histidine kinase [Haliscomenobacter hydrossis]|uniref:Signal transduction histidine kinase n=1 Tax=Haliscomenobacter hydrossis (strain ATCC 27775 / DSM 1100 / LMG 10767 / O) TaxID=760192 RepID=F4KRE3_HALH1|nr:histidine kinase [Haliscomenobacter hydrossis]AEE47933.1 putative signal transduction histidine kinase [Haliscomenobacter hydrossis DSM 1100]